MYELRNASADPARCEPSPVYRVVPVGRVYEVLRCLDVPLWPVVLRNTC